MSLQQYLALWRWESEHTFINPHTNEPGLGKEKFNFHQIRRLPSYSRSPFILEAVVLRSSVPSDFQLNHIVQWSLGSPVWPGESVGVQRWEESGISIVTNNNQTQIQMYKEFSIQVAQFRLQLTLFIPCSLLHCNISIPLILF